MKLPLKLKSKIILLVILILNIVLIVVGVITIKYFKEVQVSRLGKNAMDIASSVAEIPRISSTLDNKEDIDVIQGIADNIRKNTEASFVVVIDMEGTRYSHPYKDRLGKKIVGGDEKKVLEKGESYLSQAVGTMGLSQRAFTPIYHNGNQVGAVVTGILMEEINEQIANMTSKIMLALFFGVFLGIIGSIFLANNIKKSIFGLEPHQIARILEEKNTIIDSIREGIIAINKDKQISMINKRAQSILDLDETVKGKVVNEVIPNSRLPLILGTGKKEYNREHLFNGTAVISNRMPIIIDNEVVGAVASFNKKGEVQELAQRLTGVRKFATALRSQNHEFMNKLHSISGLIQLEEYDNALNLINRFTSHKEQVTSLIIDRIKIHEIAGLLLGKLDRARECGVKFKIDPKSKLKDHNDVDLTNSLITIIGNLFENALESIEGNREKKIYLGIFEEDNKIKVVVKDTGHGISEDMKDKIFERGFSTKENSSGIGLALVKENVKSLNGEINVSSDLGEGSIFNVIIPLKK